MGSRIAIVVDIKQQCNKTHIKIAALAIESFAKILSEKN